MRSKFQLEGQLHTEVEMKELQSTRRPGLRSVTMIAAAFGAVAVGAFAIGALAIGRLAIRRIRVERAEFKSLEIEELTVRRLRVAEVVVRDSLKLPGDNVANRP